jgi:hypothetical protein
MDFIVGLSKLGNKLVIHGGSRLYFQICLFMFSSTPVHHILMAQFFMDNIFKLHGMPHSIVFDHDTTFTNRFWKELFRLQGTQFHLSTILSSPNDGQIEVVNNCLEMYSRSFVFDKQNSVGLMVTPN